MVLHYFVDWATRGERATMATEKNGSWPNMGRWKRRSEGMVMVVTEREIEGKCLPSRQRTAWIDDVRQWTPICQGPYA